MTNKSPARAASSEQRAASSEQRAASSASRFVAFLVGSVFLAAALFKIQRLWADSSSASGIFESTWFQVFLVEAELTCGFALWLGLWPRVVRWSAIVMFSTFFGAALSQALGGARSCDCFGAVQIHPWLAVLLDATMLAVLCRWRPRRSETGGSTMFAARIATVLGIGVLPVFPVALFGFAHLTGYPRLHVSPATFDLGTLQQGERRVFTLRVWNPHDKPVTIKAVRTSCPCLEAHGIPWTVGPDEEKSLEFTLDLGRKRQVVGQLPIDNPESNFAGSLRIDATATNERGRTAFVMVFEATVKPRQ